MEFIESYRLTGLVIGALTFLVIGLFHPLVIRGEYRFGTRCWWLFLLGGVAGIAASLVLRPVVWSALAGVFGFSSLWGIGELFEQRRRVERGWFPANPKRKPTRKESCGGRKKTLPPGAEGSDSRRANP